MITRLAMIHFTFLASVWGGEQLVVVLTPDMNATSATMVRYEKNTFRYLSVSSPVKVTLGRSGLGWEDRMPQKNEGDGRSPAGVFEIISTFGYDPLPNSPMPYLYADEKLICIDDASDPSYNRMAMLDPLTPPKSFEYMRRKDDLYRHGAVIGYNRSGKIGRGSCIFFHLNHSDNRPTSGCTAMDETPLLELLRWLDPSKNPKLLQIPKAECTRYQKEFSGITCE